MFTDDSTTCPSWKTQLLGGVASATSVATLFALISTFKTPEHALPVKTGETWTYASKTQCFQDGSNPSTYRLKTNDRPLAVGIRELATGRFSFVWIALVKAKLFQQTRSGNFSFWLIWLLQLWELFAVTGYFLCGPLFHLCVRLFLITIGRICSIYFMGFEL